MSARSLFGLPMCLPFLAAAMLAAVVFPQKTAAQTLAMADSLETAARSQASAQRVETLFQLARVTRDVQPARCLAACREAMDLLPKAGMAAADRFVMMGKLTACISWAHYAAGDQQLALSIVPQYYAIADSLDALGQRQRALFNRADAHNLLGGIAMQNKDLPLSISEYEQALALYAEAGDARRMAWTRMNIACSAFQMGKHEQAIALFEEALRVFEANADYKNQFKCLNNLGSAYHGIGQEEKAEAALLAAIKLSDEGKALGIGTAAVRGLLAEVQAMGGKPQEAAKTLETGDTMLKRVSALAERVDYQKLKANALEIVGDPAAALREFRQYAELKDSMRVKQAADPALRAHARFQTMLKDSEIANLEAANRQKWALIGFAFLACVAIGGMAWRARARSLQAEAAQRKARQQVVNVVAAVVSRDVAEGGEPDESSNANEQFLPKLLATIEANYAEPEFDAAQMAKAMLVSRTVFFEKTKELTGKTPAELLRDFRLERARCLIENGGHTVSSAAMSTGFASLSHFSRAFKERFGHSPSNLGNRKTEAALA